MILITDSNIIFSAIISPKSDIAKILLKNSKVQFFAPAHIFVEIQEHTSKIIEVAEISKKTFFERYRVILTRIKILDDINKKSTQKALKILSNIDIDDTAFVALHFQTKHKIWTGDKKLIDGLKAQGYDICVTTTELKKKLKI